MASPHEPVTWFAGDDWKINATLLDATGNPFDLSPPTQALWCLLNAQGQRVLDEDDVLLSIADPASGKCAILIPASATSPLPSGQYRDVLRIVANGMTSTVATAPINLTSDPWIATEATAASRQRPVLKIA
jgi:hypothetical protein